MRAGCGRSVSGKIGLPLSTSPPAGSELADGLDGAARLKASVAISVSVVLATLDAAVVNTALPTIARDLSADGAASIWVVNAYQLALIATLLPFAAIGDAVGAKRLYIGGLVSFTLASAFCGLAGSLSSLVLARGVQGLGAAAIISVNVALVRAIYPASRLGQGLGLNALVVALAFTLGPFVASLTLSFGTWRWLFMGNLPLGTLAAVLSWALLPASAGSRVRFDATASALSALVMGLLFLSITGGAHGFGLAKIATASGFSLLLLLVLTKRQSGHPAPVLPLDLLSRPRFALSAATSVCAFAAQGLAFVAMPFLFQQGFGRSVVATGFLITPWPAAVAIMALVAGRLADRVPTGLLGGGGLLVLGAGLAALSLLPAKGGTEAIVTWVVVCGLGLGCSKHLISRP